MIIEGAAAGSVGFWSKHLQRADTNERVIVHETRGTVADDLEGALLEMQAVASGSRSGGNFMYQANINPYAHEHLTPQQWQRAIDLLEKNLGLEGHQRVVVEHVKDGRQHFHIIWNRVNVDTMRVKDVGGNYYSHERTARELEREFGLELTPRARGEREGPRTSKRTEMWEYDRGLDSGLSPKAIKAEVTELWRSTDSAPAFISALEERGYILAKGDRRDFCIIDRAGDDHSLARRLDGVTAKELRERLAGIDRESLPTVTLAKATQQALAHERLAEDPTRRVDPTPDPKRRAEPVREEKTRPATTAAAARSADAVTGGLTKGLGKALSAVAGIFESLLAPPSPQQQRAAQKEAAREATARSPIATKDKETRELIADHDKRQRLEEQLRADLERERTRERTRER